MMSASSNGLKPWEVLYTPRPSAPDFTAKIDEFVFFCSEWPEAEAPEFSNWCNLAYTVGCYKGADGDDYWCSEKEFVLRKVEEFCCNEAAKREQIALIKSMEPKPVIPYGESGWEMVWEYNH